MGLSRTEVNLRRLLAKCELMCKSNQKEDERMDKYVETLEDMLHDIKISLSASTDSITNYQRRISAIKSAVGITTSKYETDPEAMRNDLLGIRHRNTAQTPANVKEGDLDEIINYHEDMQKKITEDMLSFAKNLKEQSELANKIIKKDTEIVSQSTQLTEKNYEKLNVESNKLAEHSKRAWKCWMWLMLAVVCVIFINMVLFMKVMKKK